MIRFTVRRRRHLLPITLTAACLSVMLSGCDQVKATPSCQEYFSAADLTGYQLIDGGLALHLDSGTVWYRCAAGQRYRDGECLGEALMLSFADAGEYMTDFSEQSSYKWRLPSNEEFRSITTNRCLNPAVNTNVFAQLPIENYWLDDGTNTTSGRKCVGYSYQGRIACRESQDALHRFMLVTTP
jgi:hypothetical protein